MKRLTQLLFLALLFSVFIACEDDDSDSTFPGGSKTSITSDSLTGKWNAYLILWNDGKTYRLNEDIPSYERSPSGCRIFYNRDRLQEYSFNFLTDSNLTYTVRRTNFNRGWSVVDPDSCKITYNPWSTLQFSDTVKLTYRKLSGTQLLIKENLLDNFTDTVNYTIENGLLQFEQSPLYALDIKLRKQI